jgi:hypothetical protein
MKTIYTVQMYTFSDWNVYKWFDSEESAKNLYKSLCAKNPDDSCFYKIATIVDDVMGNNFRFFNITNSNKGETI